MTDICLELQTFPVSLRLENYRHLLRMTKAESWKDKRRAGLLASALWAFSSGGEARARLEYLEGPYLVVDFGFAAGHWLEGVGYLGELPFVGGF